MPKFEIPIMLRNHPETKDTIEIEAEEFYTAVEMAVERYKDSIYDVDQVMIGKLYEIYRGHTINLYPETIIITANKGLLQNWDLVLDEGLTSPTVDDAKRKIDKCIQEGDCKGPEEWEKHAHGGYRVKISPHDADNRTLWWNVLPQRKRGTTWVDERGHRATSEEAAIRTMDELIKRETEKSGRPSSSKNGPITPSVRRQFIAKLEEDPIMVVDRTPCKEARWEDRSRGTALFCLKTGEFIITIPDGKKPEQLGWTFNHQTNTYKRISP